jgi:hypothetical protein
MKTVCDIIVAAQDVELDIGFGHPPVLSLTGLH